MELIQRCKNTLLSQLPNDTVAKLYSYSGIGTTGNYYYAVIGTFTEGGVTLLENSKYPFRYDSCKIEFVEETSTNVPPNEDTMKISNSSFYIARLVISSGSVTVTDKRNVFESAGEMYSKWWSLK